MGISTHVLQLGVELDAWVTDCKPKTLDAYLDGPGTETRHRTARTVDRLRLMSDAGKL